MKQTNSEAIVVVGTALVLVGLLLALPIFTLHGSASQVVPANGTITPTDWVYLPHTSKRWPPTPTFTPTPTRTPTPTPVCVNTQVVQNGGFESGSAYWTQQSGEFTIIGQYAPYTGLWNAYFGGHNYANDRLYQKVQIPSGMSTARLVIYVGIVSDDSLSNSYDFFHGELQTSSGSTLDSFLWFSNVYAGYWWKGTVEWYDFSAHAGQKRRLFFQGTNDYTLVTDFHLDDVSFWNYCGSLPPAAAGEDIGSDEWTWEKVERPPGFESDWEATWTWEKVEGPPIGLSSDLEAQWQRFREEQGKRPSTTELTSP